MPSEYDMQDEADSLISANATLQNQLEEAKDENARLMKYVSDEESDLRAQLEEAKGLIGKAGLEMLDLQTANARLEQWKDDLQAGMYINCVYCGHRYGPDDEVPATMADALKEHVEQCPEHPMSALKTANARLTTELTALREAATRLVNEVSGQIALAEGTLVSHAGGRDGSYLKLLLDNLRLALAGQGGEKGEPLRVGIAGLPFPPTCEGCGAIMVPIFKCKNCSADFNLPDPTPDDEPARRFPDDATGHRCGECGAHRPKQPHRPDCCYNQPAPADEPG